VVTQSGGKWLTYIMMVAICNLHVEYDHCTVKKTYEIVLNNAVKVTDGIRVLLAIPYIAMRIMDNIGPCDSGNVNNYPCLN
jgi:hypothetical protein